MGKQELYGNLGNKNLECQATEKNQIIVNLLQELCSSKYVMQSVADVSKAMSLSEYIAWLLP